MEPRITERATWVVALWLVIAMFAIPPALAATPKPELFEASASQDSPVLRRALFGGEPFVVFCAEKKTAAAARLDQFIKEVQDELSKKAPEGGEVGLVKVSCSEPLKTGSTLQQMFKLKREHASLPVILWTVGGNPVKAIKAKSFTSKVKGSSAKEGAVKLDAGVLAKNLVKGLRPKPVALTSNARFEKDCLATKYQLCTVLLKKGGTTRLASSKLKRFLSAAQTHRFSKTFVVDTSQFALSADTLPSTLADESVLIFKRKDFTYSGNPKFSKLVGTDTSDGAKSSGTKVSQKLNVREPISVAATSSVFKGDTLIAIATGLKDIANKNAPGEVLAEFSTRQIRSVKAVQVKGKESTLAFLVRSSPKSDIAFIIDWQSASNYVLPQFSAFSKVPKHDTLVELQAASLGRARAKQKSKKSNPGHFVTVVPDALTTDSSLVSNLKSSLKALPEKQFVPYRAKASLSKLISRPTSGSARSKYSKASKTASGKKTSPKTDAEIREHELRRRQEMEEEAREAGVYAMPADEEEYDNDDVSGYANDYDDDADDDIDEFQDGSDYEDEDEDQFDEIVLDLDEDEEDDAEEPVALDEKLEL